MPYEPWQPGMAITANRLFSISPVWGDWSPVWTTSTGANTPSLGNAAVTARYAQSATTVYWKLEIVFGSSTSFGGGGGSDNWRFSMPVAAAAITQVIGYGEAQDTSVSGSLGRCPLRCRLTTTTTMELEVSGGRADGVAITSGGLIDAVSPWAWANTDALRLWGQYETAA
ncbi:hypothetical protein [Streptomyces sp. NPDC056785]|uniref:hypothetical protein n=1 Tax=Streptomyces sp. NPDC056785 TaxID=3345944 RepID=UPI0036B50531